MRQAGWYMIRTRKGWKKCFYSDGWNCSLPVIEVIEPDKRLDHIDLMLQITALQSSLKEKEDQYSELETKYEDNKAHGEQLRDEALRWYNQLKEKEKRVIELEKFAQRVATGQMGELKGTFIIHVMNEAKKLLHEGN